MFVEQSPFRGTVRVRIVDKVLVQGKWAKTLSCVMWVQGTLTQKPLPLLKLPDTRLQIACQEGRCSCPCLHLRWTPWVP